MSAKETAKELKENGVTSVNDLKELVKNKGVTEDLVETVKAMSTQIAELTNAVSLKEQSEAQAEIEEALESEKGLVDKFKNASDEDKSKIFEEVRKEFGDKAADVILKSANDLTKTVKRSVSKHTSNAEDILDIQEAHDNILSVMAYTGSISSTVRGKGTNLAMNKGAYMELVKKFAENGHPGAELILKATADAWDTATTGDGNEFIPEILSNRLIEEMFLPLTVAPLFNRISMANQTVKFPRVMGRPVAYRVSESKLNSDFLVNKFTAHMGDTTDVTFQAEKIGVLNLVSDEMFDDSVVAMAPFIRRTIAEGLGASLDDAIVNGATSLSALDNQGGDGDRLWNNTGDAGAADVRNTWDGLRLMVQAGQQVNGGTFTAASIASARAKMGKYGKAASKLVLIVSPTTFANMLTFDEVKTVDKFGAGATILSGQLASIYGIPIVVSEYMYENLNATGVFDNTTVDNTHALLVHRDLAWLGDRNQVTVEYDRYILSQQSAYVAHWRGDFQRVWPTTEEAIAQIYNIPV